MIIQDPTSTVFSVGTNSRINGSGVTYVSYCFAEVEGLLKVWQFIGNGSTDGSTFTLEDMLGLWSNVLQQQMIGSYMIFRHFQCC